MHKLITQHLLFDSQMLENREIKQITFAFDELLIIFLLIGHGLNVFKLYFGLEYIGVLIISFCEYP